MINLYIQYRLVYVCKMVGPNHFREGGVSVPYILDLSLTFNTECEEHRRKTLSRPYCARYKLTIFTVFQSNTTGVI